MNTNLWLFLNQYGAGGKDFHLHGVLFGYSTTSNQVRLNALRLEVQQYIVYSATLAYKFRKAEDGCVDIYFYDWLYFGLRPLTLY